ncbi:phage major capsid protein [Klenkia brasiliensis]|uniref:Phage major capsid protein, HK97 family n=1 Tax=Klenkia brasiliensis TaxID=333142 RepID=A0A1G7YG34_9ACTN|nr:phage major capsid protein [Klenkia brasiliensis]SDG95413.1 phage major capsid protein, HK97 family [Klenkia brasiliensis]
MNLEQIRAAIKAALDKRGTHEATVNTVRAALNGGDPNAEQATQLRDARAAIVGIDAELDQLQAQEREALDEVRREERAADMRRSLVPANQRGTERPQGGAEVLREERTYSREKDARGEASFFVDAFRMQYGDAGARERLERHGQEVLTEREAQQTRAVATGGFAGLVIPQYLVELAARVIRSGRPVANAMTHLPLPAQGMTVIVPRGTTGAAAASQATENTALQNTDEVWANLNVPIVTIGGQQDISRQSLERGAPGIDEIVYLDLAGAYHAELDRQVLNGSGASGQMLGMLQTAGIGQGSAFGNPVTAASFNSKLAGAIAGVAASGSGIAPRLIAMNPRRWGWLTAQADSTGRPLVVPGVAGPFNALGVNQNPGAYGGDGSADDIRTTIYVGALQGLPTTTDANVPTTVGTNSEDQVLVADTAHALLWEDGDGMPRQLRFDQTLGQNLTVKLAVYGYAAFTAGRYPQAFAKFGGLDTTAGNGLVTPTF